MNIFENTTTKIIYDNFKMYEGKLTNNIMIK